MDFFELTVRKKKSNTVIKSENIAEIMRGFRNTVKV